MPTLLLKTSAALTALQASDLALCLTELTARLLGKRAEVTAVMVEAMSPTVWTVGGRPPARPTAFLEISVTAGSNSAAEKAAFIAAAYSALAQHLADASGGLEPVSYVIVRELPATDWGYGGQTQQARKVARLAAPEVESPA